MVVAEGGALRFDFTVSARWLWDGSFHWRASAAEVMGDEVTTIRRERMITTIGLGIARSVIQAHGNQCGGQRRQQGRAHVLRFFAKLQPCLVGIEACAKAHY